MNHKSVRSAVVISPPEKFWPPIQDIRRNHDKAYVRWMPHINMLYPFVPEATGGFPSEAEDIKSAFRKKNVEPFPVLFSKESFGYFKHGRRCTIWLKPLQIKPVNTQSEQKSGLQETKKAPRKTKTKNVQFVDFPGDARSGQADAGSTAAGKTDVRKPQSRLAVGLDQLAHAVWDEKDIRDLREPPRTVDVGMDCLRYAVWSPGDTSQSNKVTFVDRTSRQPPAAASVLTEQRYLDPGDFEEGWQTVSTKRECPNKKTPSGYECINTCHHPNVIEIAKYLVEAFPFCYDLAMKSPEQGFQPHLTLAQCDEQNVESFMAALKQDWKDICFIVDCVHIISRKGNDPFEIKETVNLGMSAL